jgi:hypothetical protein
VLVYGVYLCVEKKQNPKPKHLLDYQKP